MFKKNAPSSSQDEYAPDHGGPVQGNVQPEKKKKPIFKKWWFWVIIILVVAGVGGGAGGFGSGGTGQSSSAGNLTITDGTASPSNPKAGAEVTITASDAAEKKVFDSWRVDAGNVTLANAAAQETTFTMAEGKVAVTAVYRDANPQTNEGTKDYKKYPISNVALTGDDYNMGAYITGTLTNNTDKDLSYVQVEFSCYDKDGNLLGTALDNVNNLAAGKSWNIKALGLFSGGKAAVDSFEFAELTAR